MRLSPLDIQHMEFQRSAGGYQRRQVRDFLDRVAREREEMLRELQSTREELEHKQSQIAELQTAEAELQRAIIAAERIGNEIKGNARREAELIVREAERLRAERLGQLDDRVRHARGELDRLRREHTMFREQFRGMLEAYGRSLDHLPRPGVLLEEDEVLERPPTGDGRVLGNGPPAVDGPPVEQDPPEARADGDDPNGTRRDQEAARGSGASVDAARQGGAVDDVTS